MNESRRVFWWLAWLALLGLVAWLAWTRFGPVDPVQALASQMGDARWTEGRSALALPWRPFDAEARPVDEERAWAAIFDRPALSEANRDLALVQFLAWRRGTGDLERAAELLQTLPENATTRNEQALITWAQGDRLQALDQILQAARQAPSSPALLFNRALFLQHLHLDGEAQAAWQDFLAVESEGPWAEEARRRLAALEAIAAEPERLESEWVELQKRVRRAKSPADLGEILADADALAGLERMAAEGEAIYLAELERMRGLDDAGWDERRALRQRYSQENERVLSGESDPAALDALRKTDVPFFAIDFTRLALYDAVQRSALERIRTLAADLERLCAEAGCVEPVVLAQSDLSMVLWAHGRYLEAELAFGQALEALPDHLTTRRGEMLVKLGFMQGSVGAIRRAGAHYEEAIRILHRLRDGATLCSPLHNLGAIAGERGLEEASIAYRREARAVAQRAGVSRVEHLAANALARSLMGQGHLDEAETLLSSMQGRLLDGDALPAAARSIHTSLARLRLEQGRPREARPLLAETMRLQVDPIERPEQSALEARLLLASGEGEAGRAALRRAAAEARSAIEGAPDLLASSRLAARFAPILAEVSVHLAEAGEPEAVWSMFGGGGLRRLEPQACFAAVVRHEQHYGLFVADPEGTRFFSSPELPSPLGGDACPADTNRLSILDRPGTLARQLSSQVRLEHPEVAVVNASDPSTPWPSGKVEGRALAVHSPQPVRLDLGLGWLPAAPREAAEVLRTFPGSVELHEEAATPAAVLERVGAHDLLHFGVHGVSNPAVSLASFLLLAGEMGHLEAVDILAMPLEERRPVVVLTACSTASEGVVEFDGGGLPWAFREAGARAVVAYQGALQDEAAASFSAAFYRALGEGDGLSKAFERGVEAVRAGHGAEAAAGFVLSV